MSNNEETAMVDWDFEAAMFDHDMGVFVEAFALITGDSNIDGETALKIADETVREDRRQSL